METAFPLSFSNHWPYTDAPQIHTCRLRAGLDPRFHRRYLGPSGQGYDPVGPARPTAQRLRQLRLWRRDAGASLWVRTLEAGEAARVKEGVRSHGQIQFLRTDRGVRAWTRSFCSFPKFAKMYSLAGGVLSLF